MKPANVMVNGQDHLYLIDFGIARFFKPGQSKDTVPLGSVGYAAPEQYGKAQSSTASDIYGLGATLHYLLSGEDPSEHPFTFSPLQIRPQDAPYARELADLIQRMIQIPAEKRPGSIQEIKQQLLRMEQHPQPARAPLAPSATNAPTSMYFKGNSIPEVEETLCILQGEEGTIDSHVPCPLAWMGDSQHLICGGYRRLACWDITTHITTCIVELTTTLLACSLDYAFLALYERDSYISSSAGFVFLMNLRAYEQILATSHQDPVAELRRLGAWQCVSFGTPQIKNQINFVGISNLAKEEKLSALALSPNGDTLAVGTTNGVVYLWDVRGKCIAGSCQAHSKAVTALSWSPDGSRLASGSEDTKLHILTRSKKVQRFRGEKDILEIQVTSKEYRHIIRAVAWSPDGQYIAVAGEVGGIMMYDASGRLKFNSGYYRILYINCVMLVP